MSSYLSGDQVVPDEDEVDAAVGSNAQLALDALQVLGDVRQRVRLFQAMAVRENTSSLDIGRSFASEMCKAVMGLYVQTTPVPTYPPTILSSSHPWWLG